MTSPLLAVRELTKRFGGLLAVDRLCIDLAEGEILGLIGPNGAGKSTTFTMLAGLHRPCSGSIHLKGVALHGRSPHAVARAGMVKTFQNTALFDGMSIEDNVIVASLLRHASVCSAKITARRTLSLVGLCPSQAKTAGELNTVDRLRLEIARAIATEPKVLLIDEAMAGLTPQETSAALQTIRSLRDRGMSIIVVEHNMRAIMAVCDRIVAMDHGVKIAEGSPAEIVQNPAVLSSYLGKDFAYA